jgi:hypothetical protein
MTRYRVAVVALALLSAGCLGLDFGGTQSQTGVSALPPGVDNGSLNATALVAAHERSLAGVAVTVETSQSEWTTDAGGNETRRTRAVTGGNGTHWRRTVTDAGAGQSSVEYWSDGTDSVRYGGETVSTDPATTPAERYRTTNLSTWLATGEYELAAVESGSPTRYVLTATTYTPPDGEPLEADTVRYEATAVVTTTGRVTAMSATLVTIETNRWGRHVRSQSYSYRVARAGGITPPRPDWLPDGVAEGDDG